MKTTTLNEYLDLSQQERDNFTGIIKHNNNGRLVYRKNGKYHREDGPAITYSNGLEYWYFEGKRHRIGGPAIIDKYKNTEQYWIYGQECTKEAHDLWIDLIKLRELIHKNDKMDNTL